MIDNRTAHFSFPLVHADNLMRTEDVPRLIAAIQAIDTAIYARATIADVNAAINNLIGGSPTALDTLAELAAALNNDANFASYVTTQLGLKVNAASLATVATSGSYASLSNVPTSFNPNIATASVLGGIKVGSGLSVSADGTLTAGGSSFAFSELIITPSSNGQTVFPVTGGYSVGFVQVKVNGIELVGLGDDYTASNGTSITLTSGINTTDQIKITRFTTFSVANALLRTGDTLTGALNFSGTVTLASAASVAIGAAVSNRITISGTTGIASFDSIALGAVRTLTFAGVTVLTHNATSLILPGAVSITTAVGDVLEFESLGAGNWRCTSYQPALGVVSRAGGAFDKYNLLAQTVTISGATSLNLALANYFQGTVAAITTLSFTNPAASGRAQDFVLELTNGGAFAVTWPTSVKWPSGTAPTLTTAGVDVLSFITDDGGATWRGVIAMKDSK